MGCGSLTAPPSAWLRHALALGLTATSSAAKASSTSCSAATDRLSRTLHVYIDGDGRAFVGGRPAADPTPRSPFVLDLMALDRRRACTWAGPAITGTRTAPGCGSALWTAERYSPAVVESMVAALRRILRAGGHDRVAWFGRSGGGTLAVLLAPRFAETTDLVTVAANLEIDAWADLHGYARLAGSVNPAREPPLPPRIRQRHYVGAADRHVPADVTARGPDSAGERRDRGRLRPRLLLA